jgi:hypothetical protein
MENSNISLAEFSLHANSPQGQFGRVFHLIRLLPTRKQLSGIIRSGLSSQSPSRRGWSGRDCSTTSRPTSSDV